MQSQPADMSIAMEFTFGAEIRGFRGKLRLSQEKFGRGLLDRNKIGRIEQAHYATDVDLADLVHLAWIMRIDYDQLIKIGPQRPATSKPQRNAALNISSRGTVPRPEPSDPETIDIAPHKKLPEHRGKK